MGEVDGAEPSSSFSALGLEGETWLSIPRQAVARNGINRMLKANILVLTLCLEPSKTDIFKICPLSREAEIQETADL